MPAARHLSKVPLPSLHAMERTLKLQLRHKYYSFFKYIDLNDYDASCFTYSLTQENVEYSTLCEVIQVLPVTLTLHVVVAAFHL